MGVQYLSSEQDTGTTLHIHHMILTSCLSQLFLTLLFLVTSPPIASTTSRARTQRECLKTNEGMVGFGSKGAGLRWFMVEGCSAKCSVTFANVQYTV